MNTFVLLFTNPKQFFIERKKEKPRILIPFIIVSLLMIFTLYLTRDTGKALILEQTNQQGLNVISEQEAELFINIFTYLITPIIVLIGNVVLAFSIYIVQGWSNEEHASYKEVLMIALYSSIIVGFGSLIVTFITIFIKDINFSFSLAYLLKVSPSEGLLYAGLSIIDPFVFWQLFIQATGIEVYNQLSLKKSIQIVIIARIVMLLASILMGVLQRFSL